MRQFHRGEAPKRLLKAKKKFLRWNELDKTDEGRRVKETIQRSLYDAQRGCCAYCDVRLRKKNGRLDAHVEHLQRRSNAPTLEFNWNNLFLSCCNEDSCGFYKDHKRIDFNVENIVDPSSDDPQDFFSSSPVDGSIRAQNSDKRAEKRALETIRVFNLANSTRLKGIRRRVAENVASFCKYNPTEEQVEEFLELHKEQDCFSVYCSLLRRRTQDFDL